METVCTKKVFVGINMHSVGKKVSPEAILFSTYVGKLHNLEHRCPTVILKVSLWYRVQRRCYNNLHDGPGTYFANHWLWARADIVSVKY